MNLHHFTQQYPLISAMIGIAGCIVIAGICMFVATCSGPNDDDQMFI